jgi:hypothetical protein
MARQRLTFRERDLSTALKVIQKQGLKLGTIHITKDGVFIDIIPDKLIELEPALKQLNGTRDAKPNEHPDYSETPRKNIEARPRKSPRRPAPCSECGSKSYRHRGDCPLAGTSKFDSRLTAEERAALER